MAAALLTESAADFGRWIGRGGLAEGLRSAPASRARPAAVAIGMVLAGSCARVVVVVVVDVGEGRYEEARAVKAMLDRGLTEAGAAKALGWPTNRVTARIKVL